MSPEHPIIEVRGLTKRYPGVVAAEAVDMPFYRGEIVGLVGKNGAGKSTVIKMLAGAVKPDAGEIRVEGQRVELRDPHDAGRGACRSCTRRRRTCQACRWRKTSSSA